MKLSEEHAVRISPDNDCFVYGDITKLSINGVGFDIEVAELTIDEDCVVRKRYRVFPIGASEVEVSVAWEE